MEYIFQKQISVPLDTLTKRKIAHKHYKGMSKQAVIFLKVKNLLFY